MIHPLLAGLLDPNRAFLVLLAGCVLIYRECLSPGRVFPGIAGGLFIICSGYALVQHPLSLKGLALLGAGALLLLVQGIFKAYWLPTLLAGVCLMMGARWLVIIPEIRTLYAAAAIPFAILSAFLLNTAVRARRNKRVIE